MIAIVVGIAENGVIGNKGDLPWRIPEDMKVFKELTEGHVVIMGRKTWNSIPTKFRPLPKRVNIVISRTVTELEGAQVATSIEDALEQAKAFDKNIFFIGGSRIYKESIPYCTNLCISHIKGEFEGDTYAPKIDFSAYKVVEKKEFEKFTFKRYQTIPL